MSASSASDAQALLAAELERMRAALALVHAERQRLDEMLHDTVCQSLTAAYFSATVLARKLEANAPEAARDVAELADAMHRTTNDLQSFLRQSRLAREEPAVHPA